MMSLLFTEHSLHVYYFPHQLTSDKQHRNEKNEYTFQVNTIYLNAKD